MALKKYVKEEQKEEIKPSLDSPKKEKISINEEDAKLVEEINKLRNEYLSFANKQKKISYILTAGVMAVLIISFILFVKFPDNSIVMYGSVGLMAVALVVSYVISKKLKNNLSLRAEQYLENLFNKEDDYVFNSSKLNEYLVTSKGQFKEELFKEAHLYKDIEGSRGRNFVHFILNHNVYDVTDYAANYKLKGKLAPKFLGKLYSVKIKGNVKGISTFQLKGEKLSVALDDIEGLNVVENNDKYVIYSNDKNVSKIFNAKLTKELTSFNLVSPTIDVIFSIKNDNVILGIDYEDDFMSIPVEKAYDIKYSKVSKEHFEKVKSIIAIVEDNLKNNTENQ